MALTEDVGIRLVLQGRAEYMSAVEQAKRALGEFGASSKGAGDAARAMGAQTETAKAAVKGLRDSTVAARDAQRGYEQALRGQVVASDEAAAAQKRLAEATRSGVKADEESAAAAKASADARKVAADEQVASSYRTRAGALEATAAATAGAKAETDIAERTRLAGVKKISTWESFKQNVLGSTSAVKTASLGVVDAEMANAVKIEAANKRKAASWGQALKASQAVTTAVVVGAAAVGVASVDMAEKFQTQVTRLYTAAGGPKEAILQNTDAIIKMGTSVGMTGTQMAEAMYHPISAGLDLATSMNVVKESAKEAQISGAKLDDTTYSLSSVMKAFNQPAQQAGQTMAQLNAIVGDGDMRFQDFNASIKNWAPTAAAMGISIQSMGSGLAFLTDRGMKADEASTRLTMGLSMMANPTQKAAGLLKAMGVSQDAVSGSTNAMKSALAKAHITQNNLASDLQKPDGLYVALSHLKQGLKDSGVAGTEADSVISKIFGGGRSDKAILSLLSNLDGVKQKFDQIGHDSSAEHFQQAWSDAQQTIGFKFKAMAASGQNLGITIGMALIPLAGRILDAFSWLADRLGAAFGFISRHKEVLIGIGAALTAVMIPAIAWATAAVWGFTTALLMNPFAWLVIAIGAVTMAVVYMVNHWNDAVAWMDHNKLLFAAIATVLGTVLVLAIYAAATALWAMLPAISSINLAMLANPITWIVLAIVAAVALLAVGIWWLVENWSSVWGVIKSVASTAWNWVYANVFKPIGDAAMWVYHNALQPLGHFFADVFNGIVTVLKWAGAIVFTMLVAPWVLAFNLLKEPALWLWHNVIEPVAHGIADAFRWLWQNALKPVVDGIVGLFRGTGPVFTWLRDNVVLPVAHGIAAAWTWLENNVFIPLHQLMMAGLRFLGSIFVWLWQNIVMPVVHGIEAGWNWLYTNVLQPIGQRIMDALRLLGSIFTWLWQNIVVPAVHGIEAIWHWLYDNVIKPVGDAIMAVVHAIGQAFSDCVDWIKRTWQTIQDIVSVPVRFVVNIVYNKGIKPTWDAIAGVFGLPQAPAAPPFAQGGIVGDTAQGGAEVPRAAWGRVMPGYEPGHDRYHIRVGGGEAIMIPEWTRAMMRWFGPSSIMRMNHEARAGRHPMPGAGASLGGTHGRGDGPGYSSFGHGWGAWRRRRANDRLEDREEAGLPLPPGAMAGGTHGRGYAAGGIAGYATGGIAGAGPDLPIPPIPPEGPNVSIAGSILKSFSNLFNIPELITDPKKYFDGLFKPMTDPLGRMGGSRFMQSMKDVPAKAIDGIVQKVKDWIASMMSGGASMGPMSASHALDIANAARAKGLHHDAAVIAIMTGMAESGLRILANPNVPASMGLYHEGVGHDHDSVGIFQQRQSWGPTPLLMNPFGSAQLFYNKLGHGPYGDFGAAAQRVQVSANPGAYSKFQGQANALAGPNFAGGGIVGVTGGLPFGGARALGGPINPGSAYMVGEQGPEIVTPSSSGTVVPTDVTAAMTDSAAGGAPENLGAGKRGDTYVTVNLNSGNADPVATAHMVADVVADKMARR